MKELKKLMAVELGKLMVVALDTKVQVTLEMNNYLDRDVSVEARWFSDAAPGHKNNRALTIYSFNTAEEIGKKLRAIAYILKTAKSYKDVNTVLDRKDY